MGFSIKGIISSATGGIFGNGAAAGQDPNSQGNQTFMWNPQDAEQAFLQARNGGGRQQLTQLIGQKLKSYINGSSSDQDNDSTESFD